MLDEVGDVGIGERSGRLEARCEGAGRKDEVPVERETPRPGSVLIREDGHGGAGVTLSWGCAREVVRLATLV